MLIPAPTHVRSRDRVLRLTQHKDRVDMSTDTCVLWPIYFETYFFYPCSHYAVHYAPRAYYYEL